MALVWTRACPILERAGVPADLRDRVLFICHDKAVILAEFPAAWAPVLAATPAAISAIHRAIALAAAAIGDWESNHPQRYLPLGCGFKALPGLRHLPYHQRASSLKPVGWSWIEVIAAGGTITFFGISAAIEMAFRSVGIHQYTRVTPPEHHLHHPNDLAAASGCPALAPGIQLPQEAGSRPIRASELPPRKRLRAAQGERQHGAADPERYRAWRVPGHLLAISVVYSQLASICLSWSTYRSAMHFVGCFFLDFYPHFDPWVASPDLHAKWATLISNANTLKVYLAAIRFAARIANRPIQISSEILAAVSRGAARVTLMRQAPYIDGRQLRALVLHLSEQGLREYRTSARVAVIAFHFMHRVVDELAPLQVDGRDPDDLEAAWHSYVVEERRGVEIVYKHRKNAQRGATIKRSCICRSVPNVLCGVCCLKAAIQEHRKKGFSDKTPIFGGKRVFHQYLEILRSACRAKGLPCISWHSFRRGAASDMLHRGCTVAQIIRAGGWKSGAFIRYLDRRDVDDRAHLELALAGSDSEGEL